MIKIHCKFDAMVPIKDLKPNPKNRNKHSQEQVDRIVKIFKYQGIRKPCIVSNQTGFMTTWHGRLLAAKQMGMKEIPVQYQDYETVEQEYADLTADNALASWSELDFSEINQDIVDLGPFDIEFLGLKSFEIEPADRLQKSESALTCPSCLFTGRKSEFSGSVDMVKL